MVQDDPSRTPRPSDYIGGHELSEYRAEFQEAPRSDVSGQEADKPPHFHGHRARLRSRFMAYGPERLADYELLELLLFRSLPRRDVKGLSKRLLDRFGTFSNVLTAPNHLLREVSGVGESVVVDLKLVEASARRITLLEIRNRPLLSSWDQVIGYCRANMAFEEVEQIRILFLDRRNHLIRDEVQQRGTVNHTSAYPREIVRRALMLNASALILVHNHPSGDPTPSRADVELTRKIVEAASQFDVVVHDHIIVGQDGHISLRSQRLL